MLMVFSIVLFQPILSNAKSGFDVELIGEKLKNILIPITTTETGNGFDDLQPLKEILKDVHILGMGEATHGTKEFFKMKHRMFEFLVEEMGYRAFAIEAEFGSHQKINDYILNNEGHLEFAIKALQFWTWSTQEVADLIEWMREYNQNPSNIEKIRFYGFDIQDASSSVHNYIAYLRKVEPEHTYEDMAKLNKLFPPYQNTSQIESLYGEILNSFEINKDQYIARSSVQEYELILQDLNIINQYISYQESFSNNMSMETYIKSNNSRDLAMAENVKWIYEYEKEYYHNDKIMLWAHNVHISKSYEQFLNMGEHLKNEFKDKYYSLGFDFYTGSFVTYGAGNILGIIELDKPDDTIFGTYFKGSGFPISFLDFQTASSNQELGDWLSNEHLMYAIGSYLYEGAEFLKVTPNKLYDGLIYIEETHAAETIYHGIIPKIKPIPVSFTESEPTNSSSKTEVVIEQENPTTEPTVEANASLENENGSVKHKSLLVAIFIAIVVIIIVPLIIKLRHHKKPSS